MINFCLARMSDLDDICRLVSRAVDKMNKMKIHQWDDKYPLRSDFAADIENNQLFIGRLKGKTAVIYTLNQECDDDYLNGTWQYNVPYYIVHRLCVDPDFQGKGIAKETMLHIEEELRKTGTCAIRLDVFGENPIALTLYGNLGYITAGFADWRMGRFYLMEKLIEEID